MAQQDALVIEQVRSAIGASRRQREILRGLGLRRIGHRVERPDTPGVRGAIRLVDHLVVVHPGEDLVKKAAGTKAVTEKETREKPAGKKAGEKKAAGKKADEKKAAAAKAAETEEEHAATGSGEDE